MVRVLKLGCPMTHDGHIVAWLLLLLRVQPLCETSGRCATHSGLVRHEVTLDQNQWRKATVVCFSQNTPLGADSTAHSVKRAARRVASKCDELVLTSDFAPAVDTSSFLGKAFLGSTNRFCCRGLVLMWRSTGGGHSLLFCLDVEEFLTARIPPVYRKNNIGERRVSFSV